MKRFTTNKLDTYARRVKKLGYKVEWDCHYRLTSFLSEIELPYMRVFKSGKLVAIVAAEETVKFVNEK